MLMQMFDEIDEDEILEEELEGFDEELEELKAEYEEEDDSYEKKPKSRYAVVDEEIDDGEKRRIMSNGIEMP